MAMEVASTSVLERLRFDFFKQTINVIRNRTSPQAPEADNGLKNVKRCSSADHRRAQLFKVENERKRRRGRRS